MIESERTLYACTSPSFLRLPFDGDLSDSPASPSSLMTNVDWLDTRKVHGTFPQGLTQSRIPKMKRKSFYEEDNREILYFCGKDYQSGKLLFFHTCALYRKYHV